MGFFRKFLNKHIPGAYETSAYYYSIKSEYIYQIGNAYTEEVPYFPEDLPAKVITIKGRSEYFFRGYLVEIAPSGLNKQTVRPLFK